MRLITPAPLHGSLAAQPSKSAAHRALLCAALAPGQSLVSPLPLNLDVTATLRAVRALGLAQTTFTPLAEGADTATCTVTGGLVPQAGPRAVDCGESGSTLRFLIPLALDGRGPVSFRGQGRLLARPLEPYRDLFAPRGARWQQTAESLTVEGSLSPDDFVLPGDVSSQFITGLLLALPRLAGDSRILLTGPLESKGYVDLTLQAMARCGVCAGWADERTLLVPGRQTYAPGAMRVEGDWSHAAFALVGGLLGGGVTLTGLDAQSAQADKAAVDILRAMGGQVTWEADTLMARPSALHGAGIDAAQVPDLVPALAVAACGARGETRIHGAARLRIKESDRLAALAGELGRLGADIAELPDGLCIRGGPLRGGAADSRNDHRITMALAVAAALCEGPITLAGDESVAKSAPGFWREYTALGGKSACADSGGTSCS
ncbi:MAG: 3-phosphoshikimate 1-carboxyvinyltransferase [Oscillospiraceae bacterium]|jgi:3-phosphoshikimate 1-carboxyvinyltransferase|nr:3-phosphoshikimate 1-carboxyvinyltransferase [Oscillospiraceae bacterium]